MKDLMRHSLLLLGLMISFGYGQTYLQPFCGCPPEPDNYDPNYYLEHYLECDPLYNVTFDPPLEGGHPHIIICDEDQHSPPRIISSTPPSKVTTRKIMIDGIKGTLVNTSMFSSVDDALLAQKLIDPNFPEEFTIGGSKLQGGPFDIEEIKRGWQKYAIFDGKMKSMYAYYNLSDRGTGEYGQVTLTADEFGRFTPDDMMRAINSIHVIEMR